MSINCHPLQFDFHVFLQNGVNQRIHGRVHDKKNVDDVSQILGNKTKFENETKAKVVSFLLPLFICCLYILLWVGIKSDLRQKHRFLSRNVSRYVAKTPGDKYKQYAWDKLED